MFSGPLSNIYSPSLYVQGTVLDSEFSLRNKESKERHTTVERVDYKVTDTLGGEGNEK